jgi:hypothetical protein
MAGMRVAWDLEAMGIACRDLAFYARRVRAQARHDVALYVPLVGDLATDIERVERFRELHRRIRALTGLLYRKYARQALVRCGLRRSICSSRT